MKNIKAALASVVLLLSGCDESTSSLPFTIIEGVQQITVLDADPGLALTLYDPDGTELLTMVTDELGQAHFSYIPTVPVVIQTGKDGSLPIYDGSTLKAGDGYVLKNKDVDPPIESGPIRVLAVDDIPDVSLYDKQKMLEGLNYIEMRDGTTLSATVWYPDTTICGQGPWPTVVNYSGYGPSNPDDQPPGALIATSLLCYASVGVNMRGTGCSGGVFDVFNPAQHADGYDLIEIIARQWFVKHGKVGMVGLSYPGIAQLYTAYTNPPHLAAIAPLSVIEDPWRQAWPGGVYNSGFTKQWLEARDRYARAGGSSWSQKLIDEGDTQCEYNQRLRLQNVDFQTFSESLTYFPEDANERRLSNLIPRIDVPVFLTGAWQDEQTGSRFVTMLDDFDSAPLKRFTMFNGRHPDGYTPLTLARWAEFLDFYVAKEIPILNPGIRFFDELILHEIFGAWHLEFEPDRFAHLTDYDQALALYEAEPEVRLLFESGYGSKVTESPVHRFELLFDSWPPDVEEGVWYLGPNGTLTTSAPVPLTSQDGGIDQYRNDQLAGDISYIKDDDVFRIEWNWEPAGEEYALSYLAAPFNEDTYVIGNGGYATLWFASQATAAHVEVSLLEVRTDGTEFLVQSGVFNVVHRAGIDEERSGPYLIEYSYKQEDALPLAANEFVEIKVPIRPFSHAFRTGSRLRVVIDTPGRDSPFWEYKNPTYTADVVQSIARTAQMPSRLTLPLVIGEDIPDSLAPCYSLRGIVCRDFLPLANRKLIP